MFSLSLSVPFDDPATPPELRFAFSQLLELFQAQSSNPRGYIGTVLGEPAWHRRADKNQAISAQRQKELVRTLVALFNFPRDETARVVKARSL